MSTPPFGSSLIGQTEKALNAILDKQLAGTGMTEPQWVTLTVAGGGSADRGQLIGRVVAALKVRDAEAESLIAELATAQLLPASDGDASRVEVTDAGRQLHRRIRAPGQRGHRASAGRPAGRGPGHRRPRPERGPGPSWRAAPSRAH
jgi:hypothetical protein